MFSVLFSPVLVCSVVCCSVGPNRRGGGAADTNLEQFMCNLRALLVRPYVYSIHPLVDLLQSPLSSLCVVPVLASLSLCVCRSARSERFQNDPMSSIEQTLWKYIQIYFALVYAFVRYSWEVFCEELAGLCEWQRFAYPYRRPYVFRAVTQGPSFDAYAYLIYTRVYTVNCVYCYLSFA